MIKAEEILPNLFYEASITLIPKPDKSFIKKVQTKIAHEYKCKNPQQNITKLNPTMYKNYTT